MHWLDEWNVPDNRPVRGPAEELTVRTSARIDEARLLMGLADGDFGMAMRMAEMSVNRGRRLLPKGTNYTRPAYAKDE